MVFGKAGGFASSLELADLNGSNGFVLNGVDARDESGWSVSSAGDINADGFDDVIIGAPGARPDGEEEFFSSGEAYVVFGKSGGFAGNLDLAKLDGINGSLLIGFGNQYDELGRWVSSAGDINDDGFDDMIINGSYMVFGNAGWGRRWAIASPIPSR